MTLWRRCELLYAWLQSRHKFVHGKLVPIESRRKIVLFIGLNSGARVGEENYGVTDRICRAAWRRDPLQHASIQS